MNKRIYVQVVRAVRRVLVLSRMMGLLDRWAARSQTGLWVRSWFAIYDLEEMAALGVPWWTFASVDLVEEHLRGVGSPRVFEWGSGVSTLWLAARAASVVSVEHDPAWAAQMASRLPAGARTLVRPPEPTARPAVGSAKEGFEGLDFSAYVRAIEEVPGEFDLVVIDGRAREACLGPALERLAPGGLVVFDNVDRLRYREAIEALGGRVRVTWTRGRTPSLPYPTRTALLRAAGGPPR